MNIARAKRRWMKWEHWADQVTKLCGHDHKGLAGHIDAYNESASYYNTRGQPRRKVRRCNRKAGRGWRR